jgi:hypothetical protein
MYIFSASEAFWRNFYALRPEQKEKVREKWKIFKSDPFAPSLGTHKINRLSSLNRTTVYAVVVEGDLRVVFLIRNGTEVFTIDIGTHAIYG